ncbi:MAG: Tim44/TimA family putative adaptor protein [Pseudomonadota bacterium]
MDLFTLLPLLAAAFLFWKLRSVLGTRNGMEKPPYDPYTSEPQEAADNVVTLPGAKRANAPEEAGDATRKRIEKIAGKDKTLERGLLAILSRDPGFDPDEFLQGARMAYEMIVTGFADGDKRTLENLLSREVYDSFAAVIDERSARGEKVNASFVGIDKAEIEGAEVLRDEAQVTVRFVSEMISATLDEADKVIEGDLQEVAEVTDVWTFARPVKSRDPNWKLVATDA